MKSYMTLGPCFPYLIRAGNTFTPGDFDGDGRVEIASFCSTNQSLNILSYFTYAEQNSAWINATTPQLANAWACAATVPAASPSGTAWTLQAGDSYLRIRLQGAGSAGARPADSLIVFHPGPAHAWQAQLAVLQWNGSQMQTMFVSQVGMLTRGVGITSNDQLVAADIDGDGWEELLIYSPDDQWVFTLRWTGTTFEVIGAQQYNVGANWSIGHDDVYLAGCRLQNGADQIVAFNPDTRMLTTLYLANGMLVSNPPTRVIFLYSNPSIFAANLAGPGREQLVIYGNSGGGPFALAYMQWFPQANSFIQTTPENIDLGFLSALQPAALVGPDTEYLVAFNNQTSTVSVFSALELAWTGAGSIPGSVVLNPNDVFYVADVDGDGRDELVMFSPNDEWVFTIKWDGSQLACLTAGQTQILGWSVELLVKAPPAPMAWQPFKGHQEEIYENASENYLYPAVEASLNGQGSPTDIRSCYQYLQAGDFESLNTALSIFVKGQSRSADLDAVAGALSIEFIYGYVSEILGSKVKAAVRADIRGQYTNLTTNIDFSYCAQILPSIPMLTGANPDAWLAMQNQLESELSVVDSVNEWSSVMEQLNQRMWDVNNEQFDQATYIINQTVSTSPDTSGTYWLDAAIGAAIWGAAAVPAGALFQISLAVVASLYGSATGYSGSSNATPPSPLPYDEFRQMISDKFTTMDNAIASQLDAITSDLVLLPVLGSLFSGTEQNSLWTWTLDQLVDVTTSSENPTRLQNYIQLIPVQFNMLVWENATQNAPYYCKYNYTIQYYDAISCNAPSYAYQSEASGTDQYGRTVYTIELLCCGTDASTIAGYPVADLFQDLSANLGVTLSDVFAGNGPWEAIERITLNQPC